MSKKPSSKKPPSTDKARKAAIAEISARVDKIDGKAEQGEAHAHDGTKVKVSIPAKDGGDAPKGKKAKAVKPAKAPKAPKDKKVSGLDAAAMVLAKAGVPMNMKSVFAEIMSKGMWKTNGATPEATLYAAVIREIKAKGKDSRFKKTDRGLFTATGK